MVRLNPNDVHNFLQKSLVAIQFYLKYILMSISPLDQIYKLLKERRNGVKLRGTELDFLETTYADPKVIDHKVVVGETYAYDFRNVGRIESRDFPAEAISLDNHYVFSSIYEHFVDEVPWDQTEYYQRAVENYETNELGMRKYSDRESVDEYFQQLDRLYDGIQQSGYKMNHRAKSSQHGRLKSLVMAPIWAHDEITVDVGKQGELYHIGGQHRLAISKSLQLDRVPVRVIGRHAQWCRERARIINHVREKTTQPKYQHNHPDLPDWESEYNLEDIKRAVEILGADFDSAVEVCPGISAPILHNLEREGIETYAIERSTESSMLDWYFQYSGINTQMQSDPAAVPADASTVVIALEPVPATLVQRTVEEVRPDCVLTNSPDLFERESIQFDVLNLQN